VLCTWKISHSVAIIFVDVSIRIDTRGAAHRNIKANNMVLSFSESQNFIGRVLLILGFYGTL